MLINRKASIGTRTNKKIYKESGITSVSCGLYTAPPPKLATTLEKMKDNRRLYAILYQYTLIL